MVMSAEQSVNERRVDTHGALFWARLRPAAAGAALKNQTSGFGVALPSAGGLVLLHVSRLAQVAGVDAQRGGGDHACGKYDGKGGEAFEGRRAVVHINPLGLRGGGVTSKGVAWGAGPGVWRCSGHPQVAAQLLLQFGLQAFGADDVDIGQPVADDGQNLVGVGNQA